MMRARVDHPVVLAHPVQRPWCGGSGEGHDRMVALAPREHITEQTTGSGPRMAIARRQHSQI